MPDLIQPVKFGKKYRLTAKLGSGGFAEVYRAEDIDSGQLYAIKVLSHGLGDNAKCVRRFLREFESMEAISHPNVLRVFSHGKDKRSGKYFYVMELIEDIVKPEIICTRFQEGNKLEIILQAEEGLQFLHSKGLIHRDVKPQNLPTVFLEPNLVADSGTQIIVDIKNQRTKVSDLGLAKDLFSREELTSEGIGFGSFYYLSPEQAKDAKNVDHRTDIYGLGATLYHFITGEPPYLGLSRNEILANLFNHQAPKRPRKINPNISPQIETMIVRAMAFKVNERYQTMLDFRKDLLEYIRSINPTMSLYNERDLNSKLKKVRDEISNWEKEKEKAIKQLEILVKEIKEETEKQEKTRKKIPKEAEEAINNSIRNKNKEIAGLEVIARNIEQRLNSKIQEVKKANKNAPAEASILVQQAKLYAGQAKKDAKRAEDLKYEVKQDATGIKYARLLSYKSVRYTLLAGLLAAGIGLGEGVRGTASWIYTKFRGTPTNVTQTASEESYTINNYSILYENSPHNDKIKVNVDQITGEITNISVQDIHGHDAGEVGVLRIESVLYTPEFEEYLGKGRTNGIKEYIKKLKSK